MNLKKPNKFWLIIAGLFLILALEEIRFLWQQAEVRNTTTSLQNQLQQMNEKMKSMEQLGRRSFVNAQKITSPVVFCGDTLDMSNPFIRERVEREFYSLLGDQGQIQLYFKRTARYLPMIEMYLEAAHLPDDLKYIAVHESALIPVIRSRSRAVGLWQFMYNTGRLYHLKIDKYIDERRDPEKATQAALRFLSDLYKHFESWPLALAAYNSGQGRVRRSMKKNKTDEFIALALPEETKRYYFKIVATKIILSDPLKFGYDFASEDYFHTPILVEVNYKIEHSQMHLEELAEQFDLDLISFKEFNPHIVQNYLPAGTFSLKIPPENFLSYQEKLSSVSSASEETFENVTLSLPEEGTSSEPAIQTMK